MKQKRIRGFHLPQDYLLSDRYRVLERLGAGWEGEVYLVRELGTGIERTAKLFFPHHNKRDTALKFYARKLHRLRQCPIVIQYHTRDSFLYRGREISFLVSEFVEGELLSTFLRRQPGRRLTPFQAVHLLHALASGIECIHAKGEYHGDLHTDNVIVQRYGLVFDLKLLDLYHWGRPSAENLHYDIVMLLRIFYDALGGQRHYSGLPAEIKTICCGLKHTLINQRFRNISKLRNHLESMEWQ